MEIVSQNDLTARQKARIVELWNAEYPASIAYSDVSGFDEYLNNLGERKHYLLVDGSGEILGWAMIFQREGAKWFAIIVDGRVQDQGYGLKLLEALQRAEKRLFGWVIDHNKSLRANGEPYRSPLAFYRKTGFRVHDSEKIVKQDISGVKIEWTAGE
jgi:ribosomal protein S18 acetylase RimI-like enzyme